MPYFEAQGPMSEAATTISLTFAEYLELEDRSPLKHEYNALDGEVVDMAGGTPEHALIAANVIREIGTALRGKPCAVFTSDLRVMSAASGLVTYPDITVVCGPLERAPQDRNTLTNPIVLVEVLSDATEAYDRGEKFAHYRRIASLRELVLVSHRERRIERFRRNDDGSWTLDEARAGASTHVILDSIGGVRLGLDEVYGAALG